MCSGQFDIHAMPLAGEQLGLLNVRNRQGVMQRGAVDKTERGFVRLGEEADQGGEHVAETAGCFGERLADGRRRGSWGEELGED